MKRAEQTSLKQKILELLYELHNRRAPPPTVREIARALRIASTNTIQYHIEALERGGLVIREKKKARSIRLVLEKAEEFLAVEFLRIPLVGTIVAGSPTPVPDAGTSSYEADGAIVMLSRSLFPHVKCSDLYALRVKGDSMIDACILDGDTVIMKRLREPQVEIRNGDMVAAWLKDEAMTTLKRYFYLSGKVELRPENSRYAIIPVKPENLEIRGKVVYVSRQVSF